MATITENATPTKNSMADEIVGFIVMAVLLAAVPLTGIYP
ncbi:MAG: branched-chain amino acid ABC transporter permease, partial [Afipia sp.]|nr:branched-chain amino acid ABC transporter permease [Afipia sp.]